jgi:hypothetical protein
VNTVPITHFEKHRAIRLMQIASFAEAWRRCRLRVMVMSTARVSTAVLLAACCGAATSHSRTVEVVTSVDGTVAVHVDVDIAAISKVVVHGADNSFTLEAFAALRGARWVQQASPSSFPRSPLATHTSTPTRTCVRCSCAGLRAAQTCSKCQVSHVCVAAWRATVWLPAVHADCCCLPASSSACCHCIDRRVLPSLMLTSTH